METLFHCYVYNSEDTKMAATMKGFPSQSVWHI